MVVVFAFLAAAPAAATEHFRARLYVQEGLSDYEASAVLAAADVCNANVFSRLPTNPGEMNFQEVHPWAGSEEDWLVGPATDHSWFSMLLTSDEILTVRRASRPGNAEGPKWVILSMGSYNGSFREWLELATCHELEHNFSPAHSDGEILPDGRATLMAVGKVDFKNWSFELSKTEREMLDRNVPLWAKVAGANVPPPEPWGPFGWITPTELGEQDGRYGVQVLIGENVEGTEVQDCIAETLCIAGLLPDDEDGRNGRSELFIKLIGPRPSGFWQVQIPKFTPSRARVWIRQIKNDGRIVVLYFDIPATTGNGDLPGAEDRTGFEPQ
jgi:hypothetical protein